MTVRNFLKKAVTWPAICLCILSVGGASGALGYQPAGALHSGEGIIGLETIAKILSVLEVRSSDRRMLDKAAEKLAAMNKRDIQLISFLCDRISTDGGTAGADIAFSLITAMIVLS